MLKDINNKILKNGDKVKSHLNIDKEGHPALGNIKFLTKDRFEFESGTIKWQCWESPDNRYDKHYAKMYLEKI